MLLDRVTITGADDSVEPKELLALSEQFPFVEWGILFSGSRQGTPRYPGDRWLAKLWTGPVSSLRLSAHLCGKWVRDLVLKGKPTWWERYSRLAEAFPRIQLNFHGQYHKAAPGFIGTLRSRRDQDFIFQHDGVNDGLISTFTNNLSIRAYPLFDRSGGAGISPGRWPAPLGIYCGYAGGLGPDNLGEELSRISQVAGKSRIWIDMETKVRSGDDSTFDLSKVKKCLEISERYLGATTGR